MPCLSWKILTNLNHAQLLTQSCLTSFRGRQNECQLADILCRSGDLSRIVPNSQGDCLGSAKALHSVRSQWMDGECAGGGTSSRIGSFHFDCLNHLNASFSISISAEFLKNLTFWRTIFYFFVPSYFPWFCSCVQWNGPWNIEIWKSKFYQMTWNRPGSKFRKMTRSWKFFNNKRMEMIDHSRPKYVLQEICGNIYIYFNLKQYFTLSVDNIISPHLSAVAWRMAQRYAHSSRSCLTWVWIPTQP